MAGYGSTKRIDFALLTTVLLLIVFGLVALYSATYITESPASQLKFTKQLLWVVLGFFALLTSAMVPLKTFHKYAYLIYAISVLLLAIVLIVGTGPGSRRWIALGPLSLQPAELAKVATLLALAKYLSHDSRNFDNLKDILVPFAVISLPLLLIMNQPDLGSALVFLALSLPVLHWAGLPGVVLFVLLAPVLSFFSAFSYYSFLIAMILIVSVLFLMRRGTFFFLVNFALNVGVGVLTPILWHLLKDYQKNRILTFLGMVTDPHGLGYQVIQSKVAIGSGGLLGKGFLAGTQTHLRFLPEQHTDFIFCVVGEEFGFLGGMLILALFLYLIFKSLNLAAVVKSRFASILVFGVTVIFLFQVFVNIGMTMGIMPVTGLPLPFLSYGGSALIANLMLVGFLLNASRTRFEYT